MSSSLELDKHVVGKGVAEAVAEERSGHVSVCRKIKRKDTCEEVLKADINLTTQIATPAPPLNPSAADANVVISIVPRVSSCLLKKRAVESE